MGEYKHGKPDELIELADFKKRLEKSGVSLRKKAYLVLLYWLGCRRSEPLAILKEDVTEDKGVLFVGIHYAKFCPKCTRERVDRNYRRWRIFKRRDGLYHCSNKKCGFVGKDEGRFERVEFSRAKLGQAGGAIELSLSYYGVSIVQEVWKRTRKGRPLFPFSDKTGYRAFKRLYPKKTPHWARYNRITRLRKRLMKDVTVDEIKSFTGIRRDTTIQGYGLQTKADIHKLSKMLD